MFLRLKNCMNCLVIITPLNLLLFVAAERVIRKKRQADSSKDVVGAGKSYGSYGAGSATEEEAKERRVKKKKKNTQTKRNKWISHSIQGV